MSAEDERHLETAETYSASLEMSSSVRAEVAIVARALADQEQRFLGLVRQLAGEQEENGRKLETYEDAVTQHEGRARILAAGLFEDLAWCLLHSRPLDELPTWRQSARLRISALSETLAARPVGRSRTGRDVLSSLQSWLAFHPNSDLGLFRRQLHKSLQDHNLDSHPSACEVVTRLLAATYTWSDEVATTGEGPK